MSSFGWLRCPSRARLKKALGVLGLASLDEFRRAETHPTPFGLGSAPALPVPEVRGPASSATLVHPPMVRTDLPASPSNSEKARLEAQCTEYSNPNARPVRVYAISASTRIPHPGGIRI